jgi:hypothetical protein
MENLTSFFPESRLTNSGFLVKSFLNCIEFFKVLMPIKFNGFLNGLSLSKPHQLCFLSTGQRGEPEFSLIDSYPRIQLTSDFLLQMVLDFCR